MNAFHQSEKPTFDGGSSDHFDEMTGLFLLEGQLDAHRAQEVSRHSETCAACRQLLLVLQNENVWLRGALADEEELVPSALLVTPQSAKIHLGWLALGLGLAGAYTLWAGFVQPWLDQAGQAGFSQGSILTMIFFTGALWKGWDAMRTTMELSAAGTLAVLGIWLLRRQLRRFAPVAVVMGVLALLLTLAPVSMAAETHHGNPNYVLPAGQQSPSDLIVAANYTRIDGDVNGDLIVFSTSVTVNGHVKGDILGFAQELRVNGTVDGNLRAGCHSLILNGSVGKNVSVWAQNFDMDSKATSGGTLMIGSNDAELDGQIAGDLLAFGNSITIDGTLGRDAQIRAHQFTIGSDANIKGNTDYTGWRQPDVSPGAKLASPIHTTIQRPGPDYSSPRFYWHETLFWGAVFVFGLFTLFTAPGFFFDVTDASKRIGPSLGWGALMLIVTPIAAAAACLTIVGVGIGIVAILWYLIALFAAQVFVGAWLGEKMLGSGVGVAATAGRLALGLAVIRLISIVPIAGALVQIVVVIWGLGALGRAVHRRMRHQVTTAVA
jgi:cytoskeletal protein CcmA (bactofilin family)